MLSHEAGRQFIFNFTIKYGKSSVMVIGRRLFINYLWNSYEAGRWFIIYFQNSMWGMRGPRKSDEGADSDLNTCIIFAGVICSVTAKWYAIKFLYDWSGLHLMFNETFKTCQYVFIVLDSTSGLHCFPYRHGKCWRMWLNVSTCEIKTRV